MKKPAPHTSAPNTTPPGAEEVLEAIMEKTPPRELEDAREQEPFPQVAGAELSGPGTPTQPSEELMSGIHLKVRAELGRRRMLLKDALRLSPGAIVDLEKLADEPVDLYVRDVLIARGEVFVVDDSFCIRITEVLPASAEVTP